MHEIPVLCALTAAKTADIIPEDLVPILFLHFAESNLDNGAIMNNFTKPWY
jgi:hypothetical protein